MRVKVQIFRHSGILEAIGSAGLHKHGVVGAYSWGSFDEDMQANLPNLFYPVHVSTNNTYKLTTAAMG